jgi:carboxypeptidase Q
MCSPSSPTREFFVPTASASRDRTRRGVRSGADKIAAQGGGADINPSVTAGKIPSMSLNVDGSKYFLLHHTNADTVDKIDPKDLGDNAAAIAFLAYVIADMKDPLAR